MTAANTEGKGREERLQEILLAYIEAGEAGQRLDHEELLRRHPDLASDLAAFLVWHERVDYWTEPLRVLAPPEESPRPDADRTVEEMVGTPALERTRSFGDYELLEEIGRGGMGIVYRARQRSLDRIVALKMIRADPLALPTEVQRFHNEAETIAGLDHPHIVPVYEVAEHQGQPYFTMKVIDGGSLANRVARGEWRVANKVQQKEAARLLATVARAVHHAHQRGILHRDLKPSNVLLDREGQPHVVDFGLAKRLDGKASLTQTGAVVGTPSYVAPEQAAGKKGSLTTATDVYGLGTILYVLLTGRPPFQADTLLDTLVEVREREPQPPRDWNPGVDRDLETICLKCLEKDPAGRYRSAEALAEDLERWLAGEPIAARPLGRLGRVWRWCRRKPALAGLSASTAAALVAALVILSVSLLVISRQRDLADQQRQDLQEQVYVADMFLAHRAAQRGDVDALATYLDRYEREPDLVGFEWHYLRRLQQARPTLLHDFAGHKGIVYFATFSPDGRLVASGGDDGCICLWDLESGVCRKLSGHKDDINWLNFSPDGRTLVSAGDDDLIRLWNVASGAELGGLKNPTKVVEVAVFSPDGKLIASGGKDKIVRLWDVANRTLVAELPGHQEAIWSHPSGGIEALAFAPDGKTLASVGHDGYLRLWNVATRQPVGAWNAGRPLLGVAYAPGGQLIAACNRGGYVHLLKTNGELINTLEGHDGAARAVAFSDDGKFLASCADDGRVRLYDLQKGTSTRHFQAHGGTAWSVAFAPKSHRFVTAGKDQAVRVWQPDDPMERHGLRTGATHSVQATFIPQSHWLAAWGGDGGFEVWDWKARRLVAKLQQNEYRPFNVRRLAVTPDGRTIAIPDVNGHVHLHESSSGREVRVLRLPAPAGETIENSRTRPRWVRDACFSADGRRLAVLYFDRTFRVWQLDKESASYLEIKTGIATCLVLAPEGRFLGVFDDQRLRWWDFDTGTWQGEAIPINYEVKDAAIAPNGQFLALVSGGNRVHLFDLRTRQLRSLDGHQRELTCVAFSPDGRTLASSSMDGSARLWNVATGRELFVIDELAGRPLWSVAFAPDGQTLATSGDPHYGADTVSFWLTEPR
jgi:WD40 repeat protein/tRNA A-37 threonylcarbamoyl transferase component Bud32